MAPSRKRDIVIASTAVMVCVIINVVLWALHGNRRVAIPVVKPSVFFTDSDGARAMALLLKETGRAPVVWRRPFTLLSSAPELEDDAVLLVQGPDMPISAREADSLMTWVRNGGRLILATDSWDVGTRTEPWGFGINRGDEENDKDLESGEKGDEDFERRERDDENSKGSDNEEPDAAETKDLVEELGFSISGSGGPGRHKGVLGAADPVVVNGYAMEPEGGATLVGSGGLALVVAKTLGKGGVVFIPDRLVFSNERLGNSDNAVFLYELLSRLEASGVVIDEYHHGFSSQKTFVQLIVGFVTGSPWGWTMLQLVFGGLLYLLVTRRRFERVRPERVVERRSPLEMVNAYSGIFKTAEARELSVELISSWLRIQKERFGGVLDRKRSVGIPPGKPTEDYEALAAQASKGEHDFVDFARQSGELNQNIGGGRINGKQ